MGILEQVTDLKNKGVAEAEIVNTLREQGISPKQINDALSQSRIKGAVSSETDEYNPGRGRGMQPSILGPEGAEQLPEQLPIDRSISDEDLEPPFPQSHFQAPRGNVTRELSEEEYVPSPSSQQGQQAGYSSPYQYQQPYYQESYEYQPGADAYGYGAGQGIGVSDTDTLIEISEQVFSEKVKPMQKQIEDMNEFRALMQAKVENISHRLSRLEASIDRLQSAILEKVGDYGRGLDSVKKEMGMMQDSFSKVVGTLADKSEHGHHPSYTQPHKEPTRTTHKTQSTNHTPKHTTHRIHKTTVHHKSRPHSPRSSSKSRKKS